MKLTTFAMLAALCFAEEQPTVQAPKPEPPKTISPEHKAEMTAIEKEVKDFNAIITKKLRLLHLEVCNAAGLIDQECKTDWQKGTVAKKK